MKFKEKKFLNGLGMTSEIRDDPSNNKKKNQNTTKY